MDNLFTGKRKNIEHWIGHPNFIFHQHDVVFPFFCEVDQIYHLACPASPPAYQINMIKTIKCSVQVREGGRGEAAACNVQQKVSVATYTHATLARPTPSLPPHPSPGHPEHAGPGQACQGPPASDLHV